MCQRQINTPLPNGRRLHNKISWGINFLCNSETPWDPAGLVWHGKLPKAGNEKKKWKSKWKTAPSWTGAKWQKNAPKRENNGKTPSKIHFLAIFLSFLPLSSSGPFSILISIFFPFPAFGRFPCHTSPAGSQETPVFFFHNSVSIFWRVCSQFWQSVRNSV